MTDQGLAQFEPEYNWLIPPGETLAEWLEEKALTQKHLAVKTGTSTKFINQLIAGKVSLTEETALKLEKVVGSSAQFWLNLETRYRTELARAAELAQAVSWVAWLDDMPIKYLMKAGNITDRRITGTEKPQIVLDLLRFFGVTSPNTWREHYAGMHAQFRRSSVAYSEKAVATWLRLGERAAEQCATKPYSKAVFKATLAEVRNLTVQEPEVWQPELIRKCAAAGVAVVFVPAVPKAGVSGMARWLSHDKALIQLSLYGKTNDKLWFTFFHEAAHIVLHAKKNIFLDSTEQHTADDAQEQEADRFAQNQLIPPKDAARLPMLRVPDAIVSFAKKLGVHPGIVVGRMQFEQYLHYSQYNDLKAQYRFES